VLSTAAVVVLLTTGSGYRQAIITSMIYALLTLSVVVVTGYSGQISLATLAFAGIAGFAVIRLTDHRVPFPVATVVAATVATVVGVVVAYPATRVRGMSLAVATLAMSVAIEQLVLASPALSGGAAGSSARPPSLLGVDLRIDAPGADNFRPAFGMLVLVGLVGCAVTVANLRRHRIGLAWLAVRANERAAAAAGIDVTRAKLGAFGVSSFLAGLAGVMTAYATTTLSPSSFMVIGSLVVLSLTYLAGVSSISGALVAALLAQGGIFITAINGGTSGDGGDYVFAINGILLIVAAIAVPDGLTGLWRRGMGRRRRDVVA
jgi:ABC-type branched-subunit amino acid transport system permease subunit